MRIFLSYIIFSMSLGNKCMIIRYMGKNVLHEKLKIRGFKGMGNNDVISIYRYRHEENIDRISILIFANIATPSPNYEKKPS